MRFRFKEKDHCNNTHYLVVADSHISYSSAAGLPFAIQNFAQDAMALEFQLRDLYESPMPDAHKAEAMLKAIRASCGSHRAWAIDDSTHAALKAAQAAPTATLDPEQAINLIDRLVMAIGTHAPHLMTCDVDVMAAHALLVKHGRWAPPPSPAKATRVRRPRKAPAA